MRSRTIGVFCISILMLVRFTQPVFAVGDVAAFEDIIAAKISREKARRATTAPENSPESQYVTLRDQASLAPRAGCGSVNIGNIANNVRFGGIRSLTVIVDAPIISTNNWCK